MLFVKSFLLAFCLLGSEAIVSAEELKLTVPELEPKLVYSNTPDLIPELEMNTLPVNTVATDKWTWMNTNPGVKPYKVMDDLSFVGVPLFVAGWAIKSDKAMFRVNNKEGKRNTQLLTDFKTGIDDYTQFFGPAMVVGLKVGGYEGRSDWGVQVSRMPSWLASSMASNIPPRKCALTVLRATHGLLVIRPPLSWVLPCSTRSMASPVLLGSLWLAMV